MEDYIRKHCEFWDHTFDEMIQQYNSNTMTNSNFMNSIINYKIENNKDIIYKEDILKIISKYYKKDMSQEEFMENVMRDIKYYDIDINNLKIHSRITWHILFYYMSTFLEYESVDIKIALKD